MSGSANSAGVKPDRSRGAICQVAAAEQISIRPLAPDEGSELAPQIAGLHARLFDPPWQACAFDTLLAQAGSACFVAQSLNRHMTAGFIIGRLAADEVDVLTFAVAAQYQRQGIGRRLLAALSDAAAETGARRMFVEVAVQNAAAIGLYLGVGFYEVGRRSAYYLAADGRRQDGLIMRLELAAA